MRSEPARIVVAVIAAPLLVGAGVARAQDDDGRRAQAAAHFDRGIEFFNEGRFDAALAELSRAHELAPAPAVLYNLGRVHAELGHAVEATDAFEAYLREAGAGVPRARRAEVEAALARQRARIGMLLVRSNVEGAIVSVDGVDVARTPMAAAIRVSAGRHTLAVRASGYESVQRALEIAGSDETALDVELTEARDRRGMLRVVSPIDELVVTVGDRVVGRTPLESTIPVPVGRVVVTATRPGYGAVRREIDVADGAEVELDLRPEPDASPHVDHVGRLILRLPEAPYILRVNGEERTEGTALTLPAGRHRLHLEVAEREPWRGEVRVPGGGETELAPPLVWRPDARAERLEEGRATRILGRWITLGGAVVLAGGVAMFVVMDGAITDTRARIEENNRYIETRCMPATLECDRREMENLGLAADFDSQNLTRTLGLAVGGLGVAVAAVGLWLWISAPTEASIDADAHARAPLRLRVGLAGIALEGAL